MEKWWNEISGRGKREKSREKPTQPRFVHHETHMEGPRREPGTPAVGGERLTACATMPPEINIYQSQFVNIGSSVMSTEMILYILLELSF